MQPKLVGQLLPQLACSEANQHDGHRRFCRDSGRRVGKLSHEGNVEQIFSLGGRLSDPNMNPAYLATLVFIGSNEKAYMPPTKDIWQRYLR